MSEVDNIELKKENIEQHNSYEITSPDITTEDAVHKMSESSQNTDKIEVYMDIEETEIDNDHNLKSTCEEDYIVMKNERMDNYQNCEKEIEDVQLFTDSSTTDSSEEGMKRKCQNTDKNSENVTLKKENSYFLGLTDVQDMDEDKCAACEWLETQLAVHKKMHEIARQNRFETSTSLSVELERPVKDGSFCCKTETENRISKRKHFCLEIEKKYIEVESNECEKENGILINCEENSRKDSEIHINEEITKTYKCDEENSEIHVNQEITKTYKCDVCDEENITSEYKYVKHMNVHDNIPKLPFKWRLLS